MNPKLFLTVVFFSFFLLSCDRKASTETVNDTLMLNAPRKGAGLSVNDEESQQKVLKEPPPLSRDSSSKNLPPQPAEHIDWGKRLQKI